MLYYNKTTGPLSLELPSCGPTIVGPKSYVDISREDEGSASVLRAVRKGFLIAPKRGAAAPVTKIDPIAPVVEESSSLPVEVSQED